MLQAQMEVGTDPTEVGRARRWARSRLTALGAGADESLEETLVLLVSELVTNAVVHTGRPALLRIVLSGCLVTGGGTVRVEVFDTSSRPPRRRRADAEEPGGRGLELICALADRWGWRQEGVGKRIWCELDRGHGAVPAGTGVADAGDVGRNPSPGTPPAGALDDRARDRAVHT